MCRGPHPSFYTNPERRVLPRKCLGGKFKFCAGNSNVSKNSLLHGRSSRNNLNLFHVNLEAESHTVRLLQIINARLIILRSKIGSRPIFQKFAFLAAGTAHNKETTR